MGALVQLDASPFAWLETRGPQLALHGAIDDATSTVLALYFRPTEDLHGYVTLLGQLVTTYGRPLALYGDRLNVFVRNDPHWTQDPTHFGRILRELSIGFIAAGSPQAKGRIETPLLVTMTGTDANRDLFEPDAGPTVRRVLESAAGITVFHESIAAKVKGAAPDLAPRLVVIPQSVVFEDTIGPWPPAGAVRRAPGPVLLLPAGLRKVKQPRFPLESLERLLPRSPPWNCCTSSRSSRRTNGTSSFGRYGPARGHDTWASCPTTACHRG